MVLVSGALTGTLAKPAKWSASKGTPALTSTQNGGVSDFSSDVGRKKFGFSHEEIDDSTAYYEGQFKLYQRCGEGTLHSLETGAKYVGQFMNDQFHGMGMQVWSDGSKYDGQWRRGQKHGNADYLSADGLAYSGQWEDGRRHGKGTQTYANNDRYIGGFFNGLCSGIGTYYFADGSRYEGAWANGRYDGPGMMYGNDGTRERQWYNGGLLMKREVLPPGKVPKFASKRDLVTGKVIFGQTREDMHRPTVLTKPQPSKYLIRRETAAMDLSAPPLKPQTAPAIIQQAASNQEDQEAPFPDRPVSTAPARSGGIGPL